MTLLQVYCWICQCKCKNFENRLAFRKVTYIILVSFFGLQCMTLPCKIWADQAEAWEQSVSDNDRGAVWWLLANRTGFNGASGWWCPASPQAHGITEETARPTECSARRGLLLFSYLLRMKESFYMFYGDGVGNIIV